MRLALEDLLSVPDEAPEVDGQLHACLTALANLVAQHPQVLLKLYTADHSQELVQVQAGATYFDRGEAAVHFCAASTAAQTYHVWEAQIMAGRREVHQDLLI